MHSRTRYQRIRTIPTTTIFFKLEVKKVFRNYQRFKEQTIFLIESKQKQISCLSRTVGSSTGYNRSRIGTLSFQFIERGRGYVFEILLKYSSIPQTIKNFSSRWFFFINRSEEILKYKFSLSTYPEGA